MSPVVVEAEVDINRPSEEVFDYCSDHRHEPEWNPMMTCIAKLTGGPVGAGTRYAAEFVKGPPMVMECTRYERPATWSLTGDSPVMTARGGWRVLPTADGSHLVVRVEMEPHGLLRLAGPLLRRREQPMFAEMVTHTTLRWSPWRGRTRPDPAQPVPVDRASPADLMQLATDVGPAPMHVGAVLTLGTGPGFSVVEARRLLSERVRAVPRLRQRLRRAPPGCGRPFWADDPAFDLRHHVRQLPCPPPGDQRALLAVAAAVTGEPLPRSRPLWSATFVTGLADGGTGLVIVMNHVLADGIGGLAVLARLVDEAPALPPANPQAAGFPVPAPGARTLAADAWAGRARRLTHPAGSVRTFRQGLAELGGARPPRRLPRTSLNRPTGPQRRLDVVAVDLAAVRDLGHAHGGTVNDVILAAIAGALRALLASRGEQLDLVTVSVPVSARQVATGGQLGNQVGVMPVALPTSGGLAARVTRIAAITRERKTTARGTSAALLGPPFRLLAPTGLLRWFVNRQRLIHTFATNLRGPAEPLTFAGAPVRAVIPIPNTTGNVTVTFGVLSYAGTLRITVLSDPSRVPDVAVLTAALRRELGSAAR